MSDDVVIRPEESAVLAEFLAAVRKRPSALGIEGETGIGKTTMWFSGVEFAKQQGFRVLGARAFEPESVLAYGVVADLLADVESEVFGELPPVQRIALDRVTLRAGEDGPATDQRVAAAAFVSVVTLLARDTPVVVAIDDVQWLDSSSRAVLEYAARRRSGAVGLLVTECIDQGGDAKSWLQRTRLDDVVRYRVSPLSLGGVHAVVSARLGRTFPRPTIVRIAEVSGGNPFYALELARAVNGQRAGPTAILPPTLSELTRRRIGGFDDDVNDLLLIVAAMGDPTIDVVAAAAGAPIDRVVSRLEGPERAGIIAIDGNRVRFTHQLLAHGVYTRAGAAQRRRTHRALADAESRAEVRARHMALAAASADPDVLRSLDAAAEVAGSRGAPAAAAELVDLAIRLGGNTPLRRLNAARHHFQAGNTGEAKALLEQTITDLPAGPPRALAALLRAGISMYHNDFSDAVASLEAVRGDAAGIGPLLVRVLLMLSLAQALAGNADTAEDPRRAVAIAESLGNGSLLSQALSLEVTLTLARGDGFEEATLRRAVQNEDPDDDVPFYLCASVLNALVAAWTGRLGAAREMMDAARRRYEERGDEGGQMAVAGYTALVELWRGNVAEATAMAAEAMERGEQLGGDHINLIPLIIRAEVAAYAGREDDARRDANEALTIARRLGARQMISWPIATLGFLEVSRGEYAAAVVTLWQIAAGGYRLRNTELTDGWYLPDLIEALVGLGRLDEALPPIELLERNGRRLDRAWMLATGARGRAMWLAASGETNAALAVAEQAMAEHDRLEMPFERARTLLLVGQLYRRQRQKHAAAAVLCEALRMFEDVGAPIWVQRARSELERTNVAPGDTAQLTPSELRIAELVAKGMTNRDAAAALFISPKTVEHYLGRVYRKLGIHTRAELGRWLGDSGR